MKITRRALFAGVAAAAIAPPAQPMARPMTTGGYVGPGRWGLVGERGPTFIGVRPRQQGELHRHGKGCGYTERRAASRDHRHRQPAGSPLRTAVYPIAKPAQIDPAILKAQLIDRIHIACLTVQCLPGDGPKGTYTLWPAYRHTWWDEGNENSKLSAADITRRLMTPPRFFPTAKQIDDCLPTLALLDGVPPQWRRIVSARAHQEWYDLPGGWRAIGADCGLSHTNARKHYSQAISYALEKFLDLPA